MTTSDSSKNGPETGRFSFPEYVPSNTVTELLRADHRRSAFDCGKLQPNNFIRVNAIGDAMNWRTYVLCPSLEIPLVAAYYTITPDPVFLSDGFAQVDEEDIGDISEEDALVVELKWLATDLHYARKGIGRLLVVRILRQMAELSTRYPLIGLLLTPLDNEARDWYLRLNFGFEPLPETRELFLAMNTIKALFPEGGSASP